MNAYITVTIHTIAAAVLNINDADPLEVAGRIFPWTVAPVTPICAPLLERGRPLAAPWRLGSFAPRSRG
jgi:hypothetical protein